jgi:hypothetical protein
MKKWGRRTRAAILMGFIWGAAWSGAGGLVARVPGLDSDLPFPLLLAPFGFVTGIIFSGFLVVIEARRGLNRMSLPRFAAWGAVSGLLLSGIFPALRGEWRELLVFGPILAVASAIGAAGSLVIARSVERRELGGLSDDAKRTLLGRCD